MALLLPFTIGVALGARPDRLRAAAPPASDDVAEIRATLEAYQRVWNTHDAAAVAEFFTEDADMVIGNGPFIRGRQATEKSWSGYFAHIDEGRKGTFTIDSIRVIAPGVAVLNIDSRTAGHTSAGDELPTRLARGTWVVVRHADAWLISALRAFPAQGEVRTGAGVDR